MQWVRNILARQSPISRGVPLMLFVGAMLLLGLVVASLQFAQETRDSSRAAIDGAGLNSRAIKLFSLIQDAETSQRGFILTGRQEYLAPFKRAQSLIDLHLLSLSNDLVEIGLSDPTLSRLKRLVGEKLEEMRGTIALKSNGNDADAVAAVQTDNGKRAMDEIREVMTHIDSLTRNIGFRSTNRLVDATRWLLMSISIGAVLLIILVGGAIYLVAAHARQMATARNDIARQNQTLALRIRQRTQHLERANRELQSYSYIVGHDLRAPLVNIMGFTSEMERAARTLSEYMETPVLARDDKIAREALDVDIPEALGFIRASMRRMDELINEILKLARTGSRQLRAEPIDLAVLIEETVTTLQHQLDESGARVIIAPSLPLLSSDRLAVKQIFGNLLENALKYTDPDRPHVMVSVSGQIVDGHVVVEVSDNGRGIADGDRERIFELFRRSGQQDRPGEGIGLAHVRTLVRRLGGDVTVQSVLRQGTTFTVTLATDFRPSENRGDE